MLNENECLGPLGAEGGGVASFDCRSARSALLSGALAVSDHFLLGFRWNVERSFWLRPGGFGAENEGRGEVGALGADDWNTVDGVRISRDIEGFGGGAGRSSFLSASGAVGIAGVFWLVHGFAVNAASR